MPWRVIKRTKKIMRWRHTNGAQVTAFSSPRVSNKNHWEVNTFKRGSGVPEISKGFESKPDAVSFGVKYIKDHPQG